MRTQPRILTALAVFAVSLFGSISGPAVAAGGPDKIVGGTEYAITSVPWQAALYYPSAPNAEDGQFCGASILNANWVVTAAHCLDGYSESTLGVLAGTNDLGLSTRVYGHPSTKWIIHPGYTDWYHDIALVKVNTPFDLTSASIDAIGLPLDLDGNSFPEPGQDLTISGWGLQNPDNQLSYPSRLRGAVVDVISASADVACGVYSTNRWNPNYELCAGIDGGGIDTCQGDSGGPYAALDVDGDGDLEEEPTLVGITSWGDGCAEDGRPGVATKVTSYVDWIIPAKPTLSVKFVSKTKAHTLKWSHETAQFVSSPITGYRIESSRNFGLSWKLVKTLPAASRSYVAKLPRDTLFRVSAVNEVNSGTGPYLWADTSGYDGNRTFEAPEPPAAFSKRGTSNSSVVRLIWTEPNSINGSTVFKYRIYRQGTFVGARPMLVQEVSTMTSGVPATAAEVEYIRNLSVNIQRGGGTYRYWMTAVNNAGESVATSTVTID